MTADRGAVAAALERWNDRRRRIFYSKSDDVVKPSPDDDVGQPAVEGAERIPGGTFHEIYRFRTRAKVSILKIALQAPDFGFAIEHRMMAQLRALGLPALEIESFDVLGDAASAPYLLVEQARGQTLTHFENPETQQVPEPLLFELGALLAKVHQIPGAGAGLIDCSKEEWTGLHSKWSDYIHLRLGEHLQACREIGAVDGTESTAIEKCLANVRNDIPIRLLHGDPGHHNVFSDGKKITAIIDWEDALCGDPIFDIAYWGTFVRDEMRARFLDGYQTVQKLPADFEQRYWLYYLRVAISKTVHRFRFGTKDRPGRPPASRRIQKALSKLDEL